MVGPMVLLKIWHCKRMNRKLSLIKEKETIIDNLHGESSSVSIKKEQDEDTRCRVCLKSGKIPIYGDISSDDVSESLRMIGGINVAYGDDFPKCLCESCNALLEGAIMLRKTAQQSELLLQQSAQNLTINNDDEFMNMMDDDIFTDYELDRAEYEEERLEDNIDYKIEKEIPEEKEIKTQGKRHDKKYECKPCRLQFDTFKEYSMHRLSEEHENIRVKCPICKNLYRPGYLKRHVALHNMEAPYMCDICGKTFIIQGQFTRHRITHSIDSLPFKCQLCPYRGRFTESLKMHMRTHTGEKPYKCPQCPSRMFINKSNLNKHMRIHGTDFEYKCDSCRRGFHSKRELDLHYKVDHSGLKDHICNVCGKAFGYRKQMMKHQRKVHKREKLRSGRTPLYVLAEKKTAEELEQET